MSLTKPNRRDVILGASALGGLLLSGCDRLTRAPQMRDVLRSAEGFTLRAQRTLLIAQPLAREFRPDQMSPNFRVNGSASPVDPRYLELAANNFRDYRLTVDGLVDRPLSLSLADLHAIGARAQITRHDCVEGWSAIGQWRGAPLHAVLQLAGLRPNTRFIVFHCADDYGGVRPDGSSRYYESIDLFDAFHPQTILAYEMNSQPLTIPHGAPLRLRVERQLGYKQAKFVMRIEARDRIDNIRGGRGGYWEDVANYEWYAGI